MMGVGMPEQKLNYTDIVHQVVRDAETPLAFGEIMQRIDAIFPISTKNPKNTIHNAINQSRLIVNSGDGRYGWKYRLINGSYLRIPMTETDLAQGRVTYSEEVRDALWPAFFEGQKRGDRSPIYMLLPDGKTLSWQLEYLEEASWGTHASLEFWEWLKDVNAQPGDDLILRVVDGVSRQYAVSHLPHSRRDEEAIARRNEQVRQSAIAYAQHNRSGAAIWEVCAYLLGIGAYRDPIPPDPLEQVLHDELWEPESLAYGGMPGWLPGKKTVIDPFVESLLDQVGYYAHPRRSKKETPQPIAPEQIYQLKITLVGIRPMIWRRIQVSAETSLPYLHAILQIVMGWTNSHLHGYRLGEKFFSEPHPDYEGMLDVIDESQVLLRQIAPGIGSEFIYEYDFGDSWSHKLVVEQILPAQVDVQYPRCLAGKRACPPEDVGGVWGYEEFLSAISDPRHPEHMDLSEWIGEKFDPEGFDHQGINELLQAFQSLIEKR
jgi:hypothetical protein